MISLSAADSEGKAEEENIMEDIEKTNDKAKSQNSADQLIVEDFDEKEPLIKEETETKPQDSCQSTMEAQGVGVSTGTNMDIKEDEEGD